MLLLLSAVGTMPFKQGRTAVLMCLSLRAFICHSATIVRGIRRGRSVPGLGVGRLSLCRLATTNCRHGRACISGLYGQRRHLT